MLEVLGIKDGATVNLELDRGQRRLIISPGEEPTADAGVKQEFTRQVDAFIQQYRPALQELAK